MPPKWSERGVFAFSQFLFDFEKEREVHGPEGHAKLFNCSTPNYYCAYSSNLHLVLPRKCGPITVGEKWRITDAGSGVEVETEVFGVTQDQWWGYNPTGPRTVYLLGSSKFPDMIYEYDPEYGISGIYLAPYKNLVEAAKTGNMKAYDNNTYYSMIITLDKFGACDTAQ
jgi:hypothetical protein